MEEQKRTCERHDDIADKGETTTMLRGAADVDHRHLLVSRIALSVSPYGAAGTGADAAAPPMLDIDSANRQRQSSVMSRTLRSRVQVCPCARGSSVPTSRHGQPHIARTPSCSTRSSGFGCLHVSASLPLALVFQPTTQGTAGASGP